MARTRPLRDKKTGQLAGSVSLDGITPPAAGAAAPAGAANPYAAPTSNRHNEVLLAVLDRQIADQEDLIASEEAHLGELSRQAVAATVHARFPGATHITVLDITAELPGAGRRAAPLSVEKLLSGGEGGETLWVHPDETDDPVAAELKPYMLGVLSSARAERIPMPGAVGHYRIPLRG